VELILKLLASGWDEFWTYSDYHPGRFNKLVCWANIYDFVVIAITGIAFVIAHGIAGSLSFTSGHHALRAFAALPVLRIFSVVEKVRETIFGVFVSTTAFIPVFCLLLLIFYCYGVIGVHLFAGNYQYYLPNDIQPNSDFDHFQHSAITMFQVLTGQNWDIIMYSQMFTYGFGAAWFFISFVLFISLLYVQLVIGMVVDGYLDSIEQEEEEKNVTPKDEDEEEEKERAVKTPGLEPVPEHEESKEYKGKERDKNEEIQILVPAGGVPEEESGHSIGQDVIERL